MGLVTNRYKKIFLARYDKDGITPYLSHLDFPGLKMEKGTFINSRGVCLSYFIYNYENYRKDKVIVFCPGRGPGHTAYVREINSFCSKGYKVITLDYMGTGESEGDSYYSFNEPSRDTNDLIDHLKIKEEIVLVGHSLGAYSALNLVNIREDIKKAVIISGFLSIELLIKGYVKYKSVVKKIVEFEKKNDEKYGTLDNYNYLKTTNDKIMFIHSKDDNNVLYQYGMGVIEDIDNPNVIKVVTNHKLHNPTYTEEAVQYMVNAFTSYYDLVKKKKLKTFEEKKEFMSQYSAMKMTEQDQEMIDKIVDFIG